MSRTILLFGAVLGVVTIAGMLILLLMDVISLSLFSEALPRVLGVVTVATVAVLLVMAIVKLGLHRDPGT